MLRNFAYGGLALIGGAITGIVVSSWATPLSPPQLSTEVVRVASIAQPAMTLASTASGDTNDCSPWDVSEVAMEAALTEMVRRGWRPPSQGEVVASFDSYGNPAVQPLNPESLVPVRRPYSAPTQPEESGDIPEAFPVDQIPLTSEGTPATVQTPPTAQPPPAPTLVIEPAESSN
jgi:hypothetical protein